MGILVSFARFSRVFLFLVLLGMPVVALAEPGQGARVVLDGGLSLEVPSGWTTTNAGREVPLTLHPPGQPDVQIEVRRARLLSNDRASMFSDSFHTSLRFSGFTFVSRGAQLNVPDVAGAMTEYQGLASQGMYRLIVVELVDNDSVWLICGFFDERRRDSYMRVFNRMLSGIALGSAAADPKNPK